jgi:hypothetical protein
MEHHTGVWLEGCYPSPVQGPLGMGVRHTLQGSVLHSLWGVFWGADFCGHISPPVADYAGG